MRISAQHGVDAVPDAVERAGVPALVGGLSSDPVDAVRLLRDRVGSIEVPYHAPADDPAQAPEIAAEAPIEALLDGDPRLPPVWATPPIDLEFDLHGAVRPQDVLDRLTVDRIVRSCNLWVASSGNVTPVHFDRSHGLLFQLQGEKQVWLRPLSAGGGPPHPGRRSPSPNFSSAPHHLSGNAAHDPRTVEVTLTPGNALYIPPYWWHEVRSASTTLSLNMWWKASSRVLARSSPRQFGRDAVRDGRRRLARLARS